MKKISMAQIGLGPIGRAVARLAAEHPACDLVGAADVAPQLAGSDLGDVLGLEQSGTQIDGSIASLLDRVRPDLVLHTTGSFLADVAPELEEIVGRGVSVVSTCEELTYPFYRHPELSRELDARAQSQSAVLIGTGVNPGFVMDKLVATVLAACSRVERVRALRVVDASTRREPLQRKIGAGITVEEFEQRKAGGKFGHVGMAESAHLVADVIGVPKERDVREVLQPMVADREVRTDFLAVAPGRVTGVHQVATIESGEKRRVRLELQMYVGADDPRDTFTAVGEPSLELTIAGGVPGDHATAALTLNTALCCADLRPGLRTVLDLPLRFK